MQSMPTVVMQSEPHPGPTNGQFFVFPVRSKRCSNPIFFLIICPNLHDRPSQLQRVLQLLTGEREVESEDLPALRTEKVHDAT